MDSLIYELPKIVDEGKKEVEKILERLAGSNKLALQTNELVLPAKDTNNLWSGRMPHVNEKEWMNRLIYGDNLLVMQALLAGDKGNEVKNIHIINRVFPYSPEKIKEYSYKNYSTIIYKNYGPSNLKSGDSAKTTKLLARLHNIKISKKISKDLESKYLRFNKNTIERVRIFFLKLGYKKEEIRLLCKKIMTTNKAMLSHPQSIIHNDLYYDQFHKNNNIRLLDWTFATVGSPFMDLSSILRNDYDGRNKKLNKKLFLKEYLKYSKFAKNYSKKMMEEGFHMNCVRDIIWFTERINLKQTRGGEVYTWLKDAFDDLTRDRFEKFYPGLFGDTK